MAPNPIDFDEVWTQLNVLGETGNYVVLATVCSIFGFYFLGLVLARRADRTDERKVRLDFPLIFRMKTVFSKRIYAKYPLSDENTSLIVHVSKL